MPGAMERQTGGTALPIAMVTSALLFSHECLCFIVPPNWRWVQCRPKWVLIKPDELASWLCACRCCPWGRSLEGGDTSQRGPALGYVPVVAVARRGLALLFP